jgi:protein-S-isoprenylcysteine O-methyltransferase Ste14
MKWSPPVRVVSRSFRRMADPRTGDRGSDAWAWLARMRVPLGFFFGVVVLWLAAPSAMSLAVGVPIAAAGEAMRIWAAGHLYKAREVTSSGPYRWFAHPLYVGSSVIGAGLAIGSASPAVVALVAIYLGTTITAAIWSEEAFLRRTFGERYDRYRRGTSSNDGRRFSFAQARANREHRALVGLGVAILLLVLKAAYSRTI